MWSQKWRIWQSFAHPSHTRVKVALSSKSRRSLSRIKRTNSLEQSQQSRQFERQLAKSREGRGGGEVSDVVFPAGRKRHF